MANELDPVTVEYVLANMHFSNLNAHSILRFTAVNAPFVKTKLHMLYAMYFSHSTNIRLCLSPVKTSNKSVTNRILVLNIIDH